MADLSSAHPGDRGSPYTGWLVGGLVVLAIFVVGGVFWFTYHP